MGKRTQRFVIKIGTHVLADEKGRVDDYRLHELVRQVIELRKWGHEIFLVTSGAVASGRAMITPRHHTDPISQRQLWSSIGQVKLMMAYTEQFEKYGVVCSQVLVTREDFRSRDHYRNMKNCFGVLIQNGVIPVVNENDVVSVTELMFTDNDELAALVASMLNADHLILLTSVDGILKSDEKGEMILIEKIIAGDRSYEKDIYSGKSSFGRGGMLTKASLARKVAESGIQVKIANGRKDNILLDLLNNKIPHTTFEVSGNKTSIKKWLQHSSGFEKGKIFINDGAVQALRSGKATSLLPVGVTGVEGVFKKGDIVTVLDGNNRQVGLGLAQYGSDIAKLKCGRQNEKPLIHYDYLFLL